MKVQVSKKSGLSETRRARRKRKIKARLRGTSDRPRLSVSRTNAALYLQLIDDQKGITIAAVATNDKANRGKLKNTVEGAKTLGAQMAEKAKAKSVSNIVFDRNGYLYHGKVKAIADGAREAGLQF